jgi:hypothetical protein
MTILVAFLPPPVTVLNSLSHLPQFAVPAQAGVFSCVNVSGSFHAAVKTCTCAWYPAPELARLVDTEQ